jgi:hypothetical protein
MINVNNKFQDIILEIEFHGDTIETKNINVSISNDVNFKPIIDYLIEVIPKKMKLESSFEDYNEEENVEKLGLIEETINEIYNEFNLSVESIIDQEGNEEEFTNVEEDETEDDDLPF